MRYGFNLGFASGLYSRFREWATHVFTGTLLPTGTEVIGEDIKIESPVQSFVSAPNATVVQNNGDIFSVKSSYIIEFKITNYVEGTVYLRQPQGNSPRFSANGVFTVTQTTTSTFTNKIHYRSEGESTTLDIQTLSVKPLNTGLLKDTGKQKQNLTVNSGAMLSLNGVDQNIPCDIDAVGINTVCFKVDIKGSFNQRILGAIDNSYNTQIHCNNVSAYHRFENYLTPVTFTYSTLTDGLHNFVFVLDGTDILLYIDGNFSSLEHTTINPNYNVNKHIGFVGRNVAGDMNGAMSLLILLPQALTPKQVKYLYDYPHKAVSHYNVNDAYTTTSLPDVTASLNMPLTEVGKYKIDYSKAFLFSDDFNNGINDWTPRNSILSTSLNTFNNVLVVADNGTYSQAHKYIETEIGKEYTVIFEFAKDIDAAQDAFLDVYSTHTPPADIGDLLSYRVDNSLLSETEMTSFGKTFIATTTTTTIAPRSNSLDSIIVGSVLICTAYEVANYTTSCDLTQQEDGLQMITYKQNNGILEKLQDDRMNFDGGVMVDYADTGWIPPFNSQFAVTMIFIMKPSDGSNHILIGCDASNGIQLGQRYNGMVNIRCFSNEIGLDHTFLEDTWAFLILDYKGDGNFDAYFNSDVPDRTESCVDATSGSAYIGREANNTRFSFDREGSDIQIYTGTEYDKFDPAKAWQEAQKTIAELETLEVQYV